MLSDKFEPFTKIFQQEKHKGLDTGLKVIFKPSEPKEQDGLRECYWLDYEVYDEVCDDAEMLFKGFIKFDSCMQWYVENNHAYQFHWDQRQETLWFWNTLINCIFDEAKRVMGDDYIE